MSKRLRDRREHARRLAAQRQRERARRRRMGRAGAVVAVVILAFASMAIFRVAGIGRGDAPASASGSSAAGVIDAVAAVPSATLDAVGAGAVSTLPKLLSGQPVMTEGGRPVVLYVGAEYCPYCAAQRWPMVVALSRFGTFSGLSVTTSAAEDVFPRTPTLSFHGATYTSDYLVFQGVETNSNLRRGNGYAPLDSLTDHQREIVRTYNAPPYVDPGSAGAIPFVDFANQAIVAGASFSPQVLAGHSAQEIADALLDPNSEIGRAVDGNANAITAVLCRLTGDQPGNVCSTSAVDVFRKRFDDAAAG